MKTEEVCLEAVRKSGDRIQYIKNPSEEVCLEAVKQNGVALKYIPYEMDSHTAYGSKALQIHHNKLIYNDLILHKGNLFFSFDYPN